MNPQQLMLILWARRRLALAVLATTVVVAMVAALFMPKQYTASTTVVIDVKSPDPVAGMVLPAMTQPGYMATQLDIINSDRVAQQVVRVLKLDQDKEVLEKWRDATDGQGSLPAWLGGILRSKLKLKPARDSNVVTLEFTGVDPQFAAAAANAYAQAYIDTNLELRVEPARQYALWFDNQIVSQRERLETAQRKLSEYQQQAGIVVSDERLDFEAQQLNELSTQLTMAQAQRADAASKQKSANPNTLPEVMQSPVIAALKADLARSETKIKELSSTLGVNHPQYEAALAEVDERRNRLAAEVAQIAGSFATSQRISQKKEGELLAAIEAQKKKLLELRRQKDNIEVLTREVDTASKAFDALAQRMAQSKLEAQTAQTNISILNPATVPLYPSKPNKTVILLLAIAVGAVLAFATVIGVELINRRVRTVDDIRLAFDVPVIIELGEKAKAKANSRMSAWWRRLSDMVSEHAPQSRGTTY